MCERIVRKNKNSKMAKLCKNKPFLVEQIQQGIRQAQEECAFQFMHRRWNCTLKGRKQILAKDTRETAFVHAITAANVAYTVTKACVMDDSCKCNRRRKQRFHYNLQRTPLKATNDLSLASGLNVSLVEIHKLKLAAQQERMAFKWGDCSNDIKYGIRVSKQWLDSRFKKKSRSDIRTKLMLHNYAAGRLAIQSLMQSECKCHGLSGSCTFSVCLSRMPPFRIIGNRLRERFDGAVKVISGNDGHSSFTQADTTIKPPAKEDLVYTDDSPDFCVTKLNLGVQGVTGRRCNDASAGEDGCAIMCCGFKSLQQIVEEANEHCEFVWCCNVTCKTHHVNRTVHVCPDMIKGLN